MSDAYETVDLVIVEDAKPPKVTPDRHAYSKQRVVRLRMIMGGQCTHCGYHECQSALAFHHVANEKDRDIRWGYVKLTVAIAEARKCILLCNNCHSGHHNGELTLNPEVVARAMASNAVALDEFSRR